ncbi:AraC family transcriptional regulator [Sphingobacterium phlebotomi]|uniref:AraC family transcriptional regulator n=1 Tax=Sphingobacterium phlebotomi TaxID=2605433 RepID=A0A5D4GV23_9SPHI|nr:AraC family transcriptional regulator [Sphingobacterium phlebotomi]TYR32238.1 AraC family transcriptional regulator [Sphingobacterium phlebotomi]
MKVINQFINNGLQEQSVVIRNITAADYLHCHKELQISCILEGEGTAIIGDHPNQFKPGDIYFIGADQPHFFKPANDLQDRIYISCLYFDPEKLINMNGFCGEMEAILPFLNLTINGLKVPQRYTKEIAGRLDDLKASNGIERLLQFIDLLYFCSKIANWKPLASGSYNYTFDVTERLGAIYTHTLQYYNKNITLNEIASIACMTPHAFCKYFKKHARKTYFNFLNEVRISEACKKLVEGKSRNIGNIAYETGFENTITFNRVFRKIMNMTPSEYIEYFNFNNPQQNAGLTQGNRYA